MGTDNSRRDEWGQTTPTSHHLTHILITTTKKIPGISRSDQGNLALGGSLYTGGVNMCLQNRTKLAKSGAIYHVMNRTVLGLFLFDDPTKEWIYNTIIALSKVYEITVHNLTIMDNHYHIVLLVTKSDFDVEDVKRRFQKRRTLLPASKPLYENEIELWYERFSDLSEFMKELNQMIARKIQREQGIKGHVFQGRFKSVLIENGPGLLASMAYVELNPVRAGLTKQDWGQTTKIPNRSRYIFTRKRKRQILSPSRQDSKLKTL